jgi:hypothetical protein
MLRLAPVTAILKNLCSALRVQFTEPVTLIDARKRLTSSACIMCLFFYLIKGQNFNVINQARIRKVHTDLN